MNVLFVYVAQNLNKQTFETKNYKSSSSKINEGILL